MGCHQMNCWKNGFELDLAASVAWHWPKRSLNRKFNISDHWRFPWLPTSARPRMTSMTRRHLVCPRALIKRGTWRASNHDGGNESLGSENADADHLSLRNSKRAEHLDGLPLSLKGGMTVENWGCLYEGPDEGKYWSSSRRKYPYPVGYTVTKSYNSQLFTQMIKKGDMGPLFMIMVGKDAFSAHTPGKAWASALSALASNSNEIEIKNIHGARYFGFENPLVLQKLEEMVKQHRSRTTRDTIAEEETSKRTRSSKGSSKIVNAAGSSTQGDDKGKQNESGSSGEELHNQNFVGSQSSRKEKHLLQDNLLSIKKIRLRSEPVNQSQGSTIQRKELLGQDNIQEMPLDTQDMHASDLTVQNCNVVTSNTMESPSEEDFRTMTELVVLEDGAEDGPDMPECADDLVLQETEETFTPDKVQMQESMGDKQSGSALNLLLGKAGSGSKINISDYEVFFPFMFDFWQRQVIQKIHEEKSVLLCAPDGAGKSAVAEFCLLEALVKNRRAIFVTPYQIQAKQHFQKFQKMFGGKNISGDWQSHMAQRNAMVLVVTLTSLVKLLRERSPVIEDRAFVVMDKFHTISDPAHGSYWEEVLMLLSPEISLLALSILVDNARYIVSWMDSIYKCCELVTSRTETLPKKYLIYDDSRPGVYQFVNPDKMVLTVGLS